MMHTHFQSLLNFLYKHVAVSSEAVHSEHGAIGSEEGKRGRVSWRQIKTRVYSLGSIVYRDDDEDREEGVTHNRNTFGA